MNWINPRWAKDISHFKLVMPQRIFRYMTLVNKMSTAIPINEDQDGGRSAQRKTVRRKIKSEVENSR